MDRQDEILDRLQAAVSEPVPEPPDGLDPAVSKALGEQAEWLRRLRAEIARLSGSTVPTDPTEADLELQNRMAAIEARVSTLAAGQSAVKLADSAVVETEEVLLVRLQAAIASGATGNVKRCYWNIALAAWVEYGSNITAMNMGPKDAPDDAVVFMLPRATGASYSVFRYGTGANVADTASIIDNRTASAGTAATAMRSDGWPGLKLVGDPADGTPHTVGANREATFEFTVSGGDRYGGQARIGSSIPSGSEGAVGLLAVDTGGLFVKLHPTAGLTDIGAGLELEWMGLEDLTDPDADRVLFWDDSESAFKWLTIGSGLEISATTLQSTGGTIPAGLMAPYGGAAAPSGWLLCNGAAVSRVTYAALFTAIGTAFGVGDGSTTFNVPDPRRRRVMGLGSGDSVGDNDGVAVGSRLLTPAAPTIQKNGGGAPTTDTIQDSIMDHGFTYVQEGTQDTIVVNNGGHTVTGHYHEVTDIEASAPAAADYPYLLTNWIIKT